MFMNRDISILIYLHVSSFGRNADHPTIHLLPHVLLAKLNHLYDTRPRISTEPRHPTFSRRGLRVFPLSALNCKCSFED